MSTLYISEYLRLQTGAPNQIAAPLEPCITDQTPITISGTAAQSAAFNVSTTFVRVHTDTICSIKFGADPTATTGNKRMAAGTTEYFGVVPGQKLSVITNT